MDKVDFHEQIVYDIGNGTRRGDVLAVFLENRPEYVGLLLGLSKVLFANTKTNLYSSEQIQKIIYKYKQNSLFGHN